MNGAGQEETWIFGYGSLVWKADFDFSRSEVGFVRGYRRVFFQGSTDHRGTPFQPGRTVTLVAAPGGEVWGRAYLLAGDITQQRDTLKYLEWREKQYDERVEVDVFRPGQARPDTPVVRSALTYIATPSNKNWLGPASQEAIARQIATSYGPSGPNDEYLLRLAAAMRELGQQDEELEWLVQRVRQIQAEAPQKAAVDEGRQIDQSVEALQAE